ncbi:hypothetical protein [Halorubrum kocurii]|uniref:Uncharacterized protein n=1 Tax=Halorubrum kocurii JCM 14978 TaxID=1230456 RepID=M0NPR3_9EURY|nr:hypothetical protein [Halorubrum kocurii]EMA59927.1 hypothetical protein C468_14083 [Halorubrum kocurii JCM 14978]
MNLDSIGVPVGIGVLVDLLFSGGDVLLMLGTEMYTPLAVSANWLAPNVQWLDEEVVTLLAAAAAALYVTNALIKTYETRIADTDD